MMAVLDTLGKSVSEHDPVRKRTAGEAFLARIMVRALRGGAV
jgi:hypothetical protein